MAKQADPALDAFAKGLAALQKKQWSQAAEHLEKAIAETDLPELKDRARQLLAATRREQTGPAGEGKGKSKPAEEDPFLQAVFEKNRGDLKAALELCRKAGRDQKDDRFAYLAASIQAVEGRLDEAVQTLTRAIELNSRNRVHAFHDPDFAEIRRNRDYRHVFGLS